MGLIGLELTSSLCFQTVPTVLIFVLLKPPSETIFDLKYDSCYRHSVVCKKTVLLYKT